MGSIADLNYTDNMDSNRQPFLTDLRETLDSIETYVNSVVADCVNDILIDGWPTGYAPTADGSGNFTSSDLYDKLTAMDTYTGGNIAISTTGAWTDVDTTNAAITLTPDYLAGDFRVTFQFNLSAVTTNATNELLIRFRLTDSSEESDYIANVHLVTGVNATTHVIPISISHEFDLWSVASKTVKLQYYITTLTANTVNVLANTNSPIAMQAEKI
jgi:hypothetical protein